jgi:hypothetical protein
MPFQPTTKTIDDLLLGTHTDYINPWVTVHDEVDYTTPIALSFPIMKLVTEVGSLKEVLDMFKLPGLSMSYDVEFDKFNSWTASSSVDIYKYPLHHIQSELYAELEATKKAIKERNNTQTLIEPSQTLDTAKSQEEVTSVCLNHDHRTDASLETPNTTIPNNDISNSNSTEEQGVDLDDDSGVSFDEGGYKTQSGKVYRFSLAEVKIELIAAIEKLPDGSDTVMISSGVEKFTYNRKVDFSSLAHMVK